jgi:L-amino acid N-acyltransferase YncA
MLEWDGPIRNLKALAVACSHRRCGGLVADEAMEHTLGGMLTDESDLPTLVISRIDPRNRASEKFASRHGFELIDDLPRPDQHRNWFTVIEVD